jgi:hypothetical protein
MFKFAGPAAALLIAATGVAQAGPINLLQNGSFESNSTNNSGPTPVYSFTGWTVGGNLGTGPGYGPEVFTTDGTTAGRYGDVVVSDNATGPLLVNGGGSSAVYFVDDAAVQTLTQTVFLAVGSYEVGFDAYLLPSGSNNRNDATLSATIAGVTITSTDVNGLTPGQWVHFADNVIVTSAGDYTYSFVYDSGLAPAKDVLVDQAYIITTDSGGGTVVPEPASFGVLAAGLLGMTTLRRKTA